MPVVVELAALHRRGFARAAPQVVVDLGRRLLRGIDLADRRPRLVAEAAGEGELAEVAFLQPGEGFFPGGLGAALEAVLDDHPEFRLRLGQLAAFPDVVGNRLLDINMLAVRRGGDGDQAVGVVRRGDAHRVDVLGLAKLPVVREGLDLDALLVELVDIPREHLRVAVAERHQAGTLGGKDAVDVVAAAAVEADHRDAEVAVGPLGAGERREQGPGAGEGGGAEEMAAVHGFLEKAFQSSGSFDDSRLP